MFESRTFTQPPAQHKLTQPLAQQQAADVYVHVYEYAYACVCMYMYIYIYIVSPIPATSLIPHFFWQASCLDNTFQRQKTIVA